MPSPSDRERLQHIQAAIALSVEYTGPLELESFQQDDKTPAILHELDN